jgi:type IV secretory pathway VirB4 component
VSPKTAAKGKATWYFCDEFHLLLREEQTAAFSCEIWKRFRKWGGIPTGATQNVKDLLSSPEIENILENSDFICLLNQASRRPENPCGTAEHFPAAITVCGQFRTRRGAFDLRKRDPAL